MLCELCEESFIPKNSLARYCSKECRKVERAARNNRRGKAGYTYSERHNIRELILANERTLDEITIDLVEQRFGCDCKTAGQVLSRLYRAGTLERLEPGVYRFRKAA